MCDGVERTCRFQCPNCDGDMYVPVAVFRGGLYVPRLRETGRDAA